MAEQDFFGDRGFSGEPVYLTDMERCTPSGSIGRESVREVSGGLSTTRPRGLTACC